MRFDRCKKLFQDDFETLHNAKIIILGVGGVGAHALDCLYRSGVTNITIIDFDSYEITNQNRQIGSEALGELKVDHLKSLYPNITAINKKIDVDFVNNFDFNAYDLILDAIDDIAPKIALIKKYYKKLIGTTGSAKRIDPSKIQYINIFKTHNDPFARKIRDALKKERFSKNYKVIFSSENPKCKDMGSFIGVTGSFGLMMCSIAIQRIIEQNKT
ncbi:MAG: ThiF family adenylyltransferase [Campylobacterota bacterium]|nr:ThiF family adenylyltransferase [Campylobacterota bacterium]